MSDLERKYYEQVELWENEHGDSDDVLRAVLDLVPADVSTVLDVGCGNGAITNRLDPSWSVVGGDFSMAALRFLRGASVALSATALPFVDESFDVVMTTDMLEHIPVDWIDTVIGEMIRVARRYVLICVPQLEPMSYFGIDCPDCGTRYHAHHHQRPWSIDDFVGLPGAEVVATASVGSRWAQPDEALVAGMRAATSVSYDFSHPSCPACGSTERPAASGPGAQELERRYEALQYLLGEAGLSERSCRSEIVVLLRKTDTPTGRSLAHDPSRQVIPTYGLEVVHRDPERRAVALTGYPSTWSWVEASADSFVVVSPRSVERVSVRAGAVASVAVFDSVAERYVGATPDGVGGWTVPSVPPAACGHRVLINHFELDEPVIELAYRTVPPDRDALVTLAFGTTVAESVEFGAARAIAETLRAALDAEAARADANAERVEQLYAEVQRLAGEVDTLNMLLAQMEATRVHLEERLAGGSSR